MDRLGDHCCGLPCLGVRPRLLCRPADHGKRLGQPTVEHGRGRHDSPLRLSVPNVGHNTIAVNDLPDLIKTVGKELAALGQASTEPEEEKLTPAVSIKRSVRPDAMICLICGKPQKMLKRHLATRHELTPNEYKVMFGLKDDYPLVAPAYAATRSALAKKIGLGRKPEPKPTKKPARKRAPAKKKG